MLDTYLDTLVVRPQHPDALAVGAAVCPRCSSPVIEGEFKESQAPVHLCTTKTCSWWVHCPRHAEGVCILPWLASHERLGPCLRGHRDSWVFRSRKGRSNSLMCYGRSSSPERGYCGLTTSWWVGSLPVLPVQGAEGVHAIDESRFIVLQALAVHGPLSAAQISDHSGLSMPAVRGCLRRLSSKRIKLLEEAGLKYSPATDRAVRDWKITQYGELWYSYHALEGTFTHD